MICVVVLLRLLVCIIDACWLLCGLFDVVLVCVCCVCVYGVSVCCVGVCDLVDCLWWVLLLFVGVLFVC